MTEKEEKIFNAITEYYNENKMMPSIRFLQKKFSLKSSNSISQYIKSLEKQNYLKRNKENKLIINNIIINNDIKEINVLNANKKIYLLLDKRKKYLAFIIKNDYFFNKNIIKNDILIIEITDKINNNDLGLFIIDNKYRVMNYKYIDGFHILEDNEQIVLNKINLVGKVVMIERNLKKQWNYNKKRRQFLLFLII